MRRKAVKSRWFAALLASALGNCVCGEPAHMAAAMTTSTRVSAIGAGAEYEAIAWSALVPKEFDAAPDFKNLGLGLLGDDDPRAKAALERLKRSWGQIPVDAGMDKRRIRLDGFVVPLDAERSQLREFLLVPYFGACIHTPPPPPNQVVHVTLRSAAKDLRLMDSVRVSGLLRVATSETSMGMSGYRLEAEEVTLREARRPDDHATARMRQTLPLLMPLLVPVVLVTGALTYFVRRDILQTPRQLKQAARLRRLQARQNRRDELRARHIPVTQRWARLCRQLLGRPWTHS